MQVTENFTTCFGICKSKDMEIINIVYLTKSFSNQFSESFVLRLYSRMLMMPLYSVITLRRFLMKAHLCVGLVCNYE